MDFRHRPALAARRHLVLTAYLASVPVNSALSAVRACSKRVEMLIPFLSLNLQLSIEDPDLVGTFNLSRNFPSGTLVLLSKCRFTTGQEASSHVLPQPGFLRFHAASDAVYQSRASHCCHTASQPNRRPGTS